VCLVGMASFLVWCVEFRVLVAHKLLDKHLRNT
jgi:hypothetical protein